MKRTLICGLGLLALAGCGQQPREVVYVPAPTPTTDGIDLVSLYPAMFSSLWDDYTIEEQEGMCDLYLLSPETVRDAFTSNLGEVDPDAAWRALRDFLDEEC